MSGSLRIRLVLAGVSLAATMLLASNSAQAEWRGGGQSWDRTPQHRPDISRSWDRGSQDRHDGRYDGHGWRPSGWGWNGPAFAPTYPRQGYYVYPGAYRPGWTSTGCYGGYNGWVTPSRGITVIVSVR